MPTRFCANIAVLALLAVVLSGCTSRSIRDEPLTFDVAGPVAVDIESFAGDVNIYVDDTLDHAEVSIVRSSNFGARRSSEGAASLEDIDYKVDLESTDIGPTLRIHAWTNSPEPHLQQANITVRLPGVNQMRVSTTRGRVYAIDIQGAVDITTTEGDVRLMTNWPMLEAVNIRNDRGDIDYRVRGESTGLVIAETTDGKVMHDCRFCKFRIREYGGRRLIAQINDGENPIDLFTVEGDIRVTVVPNPTEVGIFIIDP